MQLGLIEDDSISAEVLRIMTTNMGFTVSFEANSLFQWEHKQPLITQFPEFFLIDLHFSGSNKAIEIARWIKENTKSKIIFLTNNSDQQSLIQAKALLPHSILKKPIFSDDLRHALTLN